MAIKRIIHFFYYWEKTNEKKRNAAIDLSHNIKIH